MTKEDFITEIAVEVGKPKAEVRRMVDAFTKIVSDKLSKGIRVQLTGFGSFETRIRLARKGRNPQTGEEIDIPQRTVPVFKPGKLLKEKVNG